MWKFIVIGISLFSLAAFGVEVSKPITVEFKIGKKIIVTVHDIKDAIASENTESHEWSVAIEMTPEAATKFQDVTKKNIGKKMSILVDGKVLTSPVIRAEIAGGHAMLQGKFSKEDADAIVDRIKEANNPK